MNTINSAVLLLFVLGAWFIDATTPANEIMEVAADNPASVDAIVPLDILPFDPPFKYKAPTSEKILEPDPEQAPSTLPSYLYAIRPRVCEGKMRIRDYLESNCTHLACGVVSATFCEILRQSKNEVNQISEFIGHQDLQPLLAKQNAPATKYQGSMDPHSGRFLMDGHFVTVSIDEDETDQNKKSSQFSAVYIMAMFGPITFISPLLPVYCFARYILC